MDRIINLSEFLYDLVFRIVPALASVLAVWELLKALYNRAISRFPVRSVLGPLCDDKLPCLVFVNHLYTPQRDNRYMLSLPDYFPPSTTGKEQGRQNIPHVIAKADTTAIGDLLNVMGQAGRYQAIEVVDPVTHWDKWDASVVCIGGSFKSQQVWKKCHPLPVVLDGSDFKILLTGERLSAYSPQDFGLLCKTLNPENGRDVWLIMGLGVYGTEAAGYYLRTNLRTLGRMFGTRPFAVVVRTTLTEGGRQASLWWYSPEVTLWRQIMFWRTYRGFVRRREQIPRVHRGGGEPTPPTVTTGSGRSA